MSELDRIGIDTLVLKTSEFLIAEDEEVMVREKEFPFSRRNRNTSTTSMTWARARGKVRDGAIAFKNGSNVQATMTSHPVCGFITYVKTCMPKWHAPTNLIVQSVDGDRAGIIACQHELAGIGIGTDLQQAHLAKLHLCRTIALDRPWKSFLHLFDHIPAQRLTREPLPKHPTTLLWRNNEWELMLYEKRLEMAGKGHDVTGLPRHLLRAEIRLQRAAKIRNSLLARTVEELWDEHGDLSRIFRHTIEKTLFKVDASLEESIKKVKSPSDLNQMLNAVSHLKRPTDEMKTLIHLMGANQMDALYGEGTIREIARQRNKVKRWRTYRLMQHIRQARLFFALIESQQGQRTTSLDLFNELREKLTGEPETESEKEQLAA